MTQLNAKTQTIREIFQQNYIIPEYQRRYSWDKEQCLQLVEDLHDFCESDSKQYFLGCIVIASDETEERYIIDGQQRLMTLSLLIKVLLDKAGTYDDLRLCLQVKDSRSGKYIEKLRLISNVVDDDNKSFTSVLLNKDTDTNNRFSENYEHLLKAIDELGLGTKLEKFIEKLLNKVVLLPIECDSVDTALTIFQTLNDRGMPLRDADIFKAKLYNNTSNSNEKNKFIESWNSLREQAENDGYSIDQYFRIYMHNLRAKNNDIGKEIKLRKYFDEKSKRLYKSKEVMDCLKKYQAAYNWNSSDIVTIWWSILDTYPNIYWQYPVYIFLTKHGDYNGEEFSITKQQEGEFIKLLKSTVRYCYIKGVATNSVNTIKDTIFKVCAAIEYDKDYEIIYQGNMKDNVDTFKQELNSSNYGRYQKGLVLIGSALHPSQEKLENRTFYAYMLKHIKYDIEHILPRAWNHYDGWDAESYKEDINKIGNLIPLEKILNSKASNEFFSRKKEGSYKISKISEVKELCKITKWTPNALKKRHADISKRLDKFFCDY